MLQLSHALTRRTRITHRYSIDHSENEETSEKEKKSASDGNETTWDQTTNPQALTPQAMDAAEEQESPNSPIEWPSVIGCYKYTYK